MSESGELLDLLWFLLVLGALAILFIAGIRVPPGPPGARRQLVRLGLIGGAAAFTILANVAIYKHDAHVDLTRERAFTPAPETLAVVRALTQDVDLVYFYQNQSPAGRAAKEMVEIIGRTNPRLHVQTVDPDQTPAIANELGVRLYNAALLRSGTDRLEVVTTDDREIALGIQRLLRKDPRPVCFTQGHGEYDIDNFEFHTHFEGQQGHNHDAQGMAVVQMEQHGLGRLRRALERLGYATRKLVLPIERTVPESCAVVVIANPRTPFGAPEMDVLAAYLNRGGALLLLVEPDYPVPPPLAALLARAGVRLGEGVIVDPTSHYYTDEQMIAVTEYARHPSTANLALSFYPGTRPVELVPVPGVQGQPLFRSSASARAVPVQSRDKRLVGGGGPAGALALAAVAEGRLTAGDPAHPFRLAVVGDVDFASNSFFPYLSNADVVLNLIIWLRREERGVNLKPPVEVLPTVALTNSQMQGIFIGVVLILPGAIAILGGIVWWVRRY